jgi:hypothetical protein
VVSQIEAIIIPEIFQKNFNKLKKINRRAKNPQFITKTHSGKSFEKRNEYRQSHAAQARNVAKQQKDHVK